MPINNIDKILASLQQEIAKTKEGLKREQQLSRLEEVAKVYQGEDELVSFSEIAERVKNEKEEFRIMSGWPGLDDLLKGFRSQQLVVVSALTKSGKTSFLMDLTTRLKEYNPLWLPFEESAEELIRKFLERGEEAPHGFTPSVMKGGELDWIETKIVEGIVKFGSKIAFIDQLDFIVPLGTDNHALRVGEAMRGLKGMAKKWNITIVLICHLVKTKMDTQPTLEDLKGSSSIGQEADTVILLWREMKREQGQVVITNNVNVSVQANRRGGKTGNVKMVFEDGHFIERAWKSSEESLSEIEDRYSNF
jgi:replicative DNA helicase